MWCGPGSGGDNECLHHLITWCLLLRVLQTGSIEGKHDLQLGRRVGDKVTAQRLAEAAA